MNEELDDMPNNLVATGAVYMALCYSAEVKNGVASVTILEGNQIQVEFSFMKSPYRLTVERVR